MQKLLDVVVQSKWWSEAVAVHAGLSDIVLGIWTPERGGTNLALWRETTFAGLEGVLAEMFWNAIRVKFRIMANDQYSSGFELVAPGAPIHCAGIWRK